MNIEEVMTPEQKNRLFARLVSIGASRTVKREGNVGFEATSLEGGPITYSVRLEFFNGKTMDLRISEAEYTQIAVHVSGCNSVEEYEELIKNARSG